MRSLPKALVLALAPAWAALAHAQERPAPSTLVDQARLFLPPGVGDPPPPLTPEGARDARAAEKLCAAALELDPESGYAAWWLGHARLLLGADLVARGDRDAGRARFRAAVAAFERAEALDPDSAWAPWAAALARWELDELQAALAAFDRAIDVANRAIDAAGEGDPAARDALFVRFKARQWRADTRMRAFEFERAREEFRSFYADNGNNRWDLGYSLAETYLRERDFAGARAVYEDLLTVEEYRPFGSTYAQLGYLAGLCGEPGPAVEWLEQALVFERAPTLYPRLWLWMLAREETRRAAAEDDLDAFLRNPPAEVSAWDLRLGAFVLGRTSVDEFEAAARAEEARRLAEAEALDDLACEAAFYAGWRLERDAERAGDGEALLRRALAAQHRALGFAPRQHKWEWEYARSAFARLAGALQLAPEPGFRVEGRHIALAPDRPLTRAHGATEGALGAVFFHRPGAEKRREGPGALLGALLPGDLLECVVEGQDGSRAAVRLVVDAR